MGPVIDVPGADQDALLCAQILTELCAGRPPEVAIVLGSGLGDVADVIDKPAQLDYFDLPGFPHTAIEGHTGRVLDGVVQDVCVLVMQGRVHYYESGQADVMATPLRALKAAGCEVLLMTNAAGGLDPAVRPGSLMLVSDHINFTGTNPLIGFARGGSAFVDMSAAYDRDLRELLRIAAARTAIPLHEGVYACFAGPSFETPAEIKAAGILGAHAVGMSLVPETILARHAGLRVAALSVITNHAAGIADAPLSHRQTMRTAAKASGAVSRLVRGFLAEVAAARDN